MQKLCAELHFGPQQPSEAEPQSVLQNALLGYFLWSGGLPAVVVVVVVLFALPVCNLRACNVLFVRLKVCFIIFANFLLKHLWVCASVCGFKFVHVFQCSTVY